MTGSNMRDHFFLNDKKDLNKRRASLKKNILIGIAWTAGLVLLAALGWFLFFKAQFIFYKDNHYKFSIKYPRSWKVRKPQRPYVAVIFMRPKETVMDTMQENFNVTVEPVPANLLTLSNFSAKIKEQMTDLFGPNLKITEDKPLQWGWRQGHKMIFVAPKPDHLIMVNAWVLKSDQAYILTFLGDMNKYKQDATVVDEMIRSFHLE
jgi:hypothetical protein